MPLQYSCRVSLHNSLWGVGGAQKVILSPLHSLPFINAHLTDHNLVAAPVSWGLFEAGPLYEYWWPLNGKLLSSILCTDSTFIVQWLFLLIIHPNPRAPALIPPPTSSAGQAG